MLRPYRSPSQHRPPVPQLPRPHRRRSTRRWPRSPPSPYGPGGRDPGRWVRWLIGVTGETGILLLALGAARTIRAQGGSGQAALGPARPTWRDLRSGLLWMLLELLVRAVVVGVFEAVLGREAVRNASNLHVSGHHSVIAIVAALLVASVLAPAAEEVQCRGVLLRAGMAHWGFRRAALLSSLFFGLLHADQASSVAGALVLATNIAVFGYLQCVLVRRSGRLAPAMVAHGASNGIALWIALAA